MKKQAYTKRSLVIPETFEILGTTMSVELRKNRTAMEAGNIGVTLRSRNHIVLYKESANGPLVREIVEQTFMHELVHVVFDAVGLTDLAGNEDIVDRVSRGLHQVLATSQGDAVPDDTDFS